MPTNDRLRSPPGLFNCELTGEVFMRLIRFGHHQQSAGIFVQPMYNAGSKGLLILFGDRKSTRLNSSHVAISYAVFCLKKKIKDERDTRTNNESKEHTAKT